MTRKDWIRLEHLQAGEVLETSAGVAEVSAIEAVAGEQRVYNFEVEGAHNDWVGAAGVLVHNEDPACPWQEQPRDEKGRFKSTTGKKSTKPGEVAEKEVWDDLEAQGHTVNRRQVHTVNENGQSRVYDGTYTPKGTDKTIGIETKSGSARKTKAQRNYDDAVNAGTSMAKGVGSSAGIEIDGVETFRK